MYRFKFWISSDCVYNYIEIKPYYIETYSYVNLQYVFNDNGDNLHQIENKIQEEFLNI